MGSNYLCSAIGLLACAAAPLLAQSGAKNGEWRTYGGDLGSTRYSALDQINAGNFKNLEVAWRFKTDSLGPHPEFNFQSTPLMVNGVIYTTAGTRRDVAALDAATGEMLWMHSEDEGKRAELSPRKLSGRGLAYWTDGRDARIYYVTIGYRLVALDAKTGVPVAGFGQNGVVDLRQEDDQEMDAVTADIGYHAAPVVARNIVIVGAAHSPGGNPKSRKNVKGFVRGFDTRTGKRVWIFHTIPMPGEFGIDTWQNDSWSYTGNTGVWGQITVDEEAGVVYLPVETPTGDFYGGHRPGNGLFGETLVALDLNTGKRLWHYQFIHHGIWDWDIPCAPILTDINVGGRRIKAISQPTKQAWVYTFDRTNGKPVWPIEEKPVAQSTVPGEKTSATQPFPSKPPAFDRQGVSVDDLIDYTPELHAAALELVSHYKLGPIFTPAVESKLEGPLATLMLPSATGGGNWQGGSFDPETGIFYIFSNTNITQLGLVKSDGSRSDMDYISGRARPATANTARGGRGGRGGTGAAAGRGGGGDEGEGEGGGGLNVQGLPLVKPPYGRITAIDMNKGEIVWQIAHGETPDNIKNNPALKGVTIPRTGRPGRIGTLVTKTLVVAGEGGFFTTPSGSRGAMLRAYDKATGQEVGAVYMPAPQTGSPMTYMLGGKQYIVVAIAGGAYSGELVAFRLGT
jgi:quinoprotein glucose dehydrogenase